MQKGLAGTGLKQDGALLLQPMYSVTGKLWSLQTIDGKGTKINLPKGRKVGLYLPIGKVTDCIVIAEGWATAASCHLATGAAAVCCFGEGNMLAVATALCQKYPDMVLVLVADNDSDKPVNVGVQAATKAAQAVGGLLVVPALPDGGKCDADDLRRVLGLEELKRQIHDAQRVQAEQAEDQGDAWPQPCPLPESLPKVAKFDPDLLPQCLQAWVLDVAHRTQAEPDYAAVALLVALSSLIGARAVIHPKQRDDWQVVPNLWGLIVGRPSAMKSPALTAALQPLKRLEAQERLRHAEELQAWELDCKVVKLQSDANEKKAAKVANRDPSQARALLEPAKLPPAPVMRRFLVNDSTVERLGELLQENPWGLLAYRDELYGLLASMDRAGQEGSRAFYLQAYDGNQGYTFDRIMRGETYIPRVCLAMLGGIQPARLHDYARNAVQGGAGDDGLLQRFGMAMWPDGADSFTLVDQWPDTEARQQLNAAFDRLANLLPERGELEQEDEPKAYRFAPDAQQAWNSWYVALQNELRAGELHPALESHLAKFPKLVPALALVFALVDTPDCEAVGLVEVMRAIAWADYLRSHAYRIYSAAGKPDMGAAHALLAKIREGKVADGFKLKDVQQKGWAWLDTTDGVKRAAAVLVDYDWVRLEVAKSGDEKGRGRPSESYRINPAALGKAGHEKK